MGRLMSEPEAADYLGLTPGQLRARRERRQVPYVHVGRRVMYDTRSLERWIEASTIPARSAW